MSVNPSGGMSELEYADHRVQVISLNVTNDPDSDSDALDEVVQEDPVGKNRLDSDEIAELAGFYRQFRVLLFDENANSQTEPGDVIAELGMGINLSENEFAEQSANNNANSRGVDGIGPGTIRIANYEDAGVLDTASFTGNAGFLGSAGEGGTGQNAAQDRWADLRGFAGSGPFVDITDDITIHVELDERNYVARSQLAAEYILYWNVSELPEGRASFSRPSARR